MTLDPCRAALPQAINVNEEARASAPASHKVPAPPSTLELRMYHSPPPRQVSYTPSPSPPASSTPETPDGNNGYVYCADADEGAVGVSMTWMPSPDHAVPPDWPPISGAGVRAVTPPGGVSVDAPLFVPQPAAPRGIVRVPVMCGVGVKLSRHAPSGSLTVCDIAANGPADRTGLISIGDQLVSIGGVPVGGMDVRRAQDALRGLPGTTVMVVLWHSAGSRRGPKSEEGMLINAVVVREIFVYSEQALA